MNRVLTGFFLTAFCSTQAALASPATDKVSLGDRLLAQGNAESALHFYDQAVELNASYWPAYLHRGDALMKLGQTRYATDDYRKVLQLYPGCPEALMRLHGHNVNRTARSKHNRKNH